MEKNNDEVHVSTDEVRAGSTPHMTRYILSISLVLIVVLFLALLILYR